MFEYDGDGVNVVDGVVDGVDGGGGEADEVGGGIVVGGVGTNGAIAPKIVIS